MLVFIPFALCFVTLRGIFMRFPELTYWQDATVPVPCFLLFLCFRKAIQEIFSELDETSSRTPIFLGRGLKTEWELEGGQGPASPWGGVAQPLAAPPCGKTPLVASWWCPFAYKNLPTENPRGIGEISIRVPQLRHHRRRILGDRSLCSGTLPGRGSALIRCKRIYNFWRSMLVLHQLLYVLSTLCGTFMIYLD
jgi:hypothetical protein